MYVCEKWPIQFVISVLLITMVIPPSSHLRILGLFPHPGLSHFNFFHPIMLGLADAGHDVTVVSHFSDLHAPANYKNVIIGDETPMVNSVNLEVSRNVLKYTTKHQDDCYFVSFRSCSNNVNHFVTSENSLCFTDGVVDHVK